MFAQGFNELFDLRQPTVHGPLAPTTQVTPGIIRAAIFPEQLELLLPEISTNRAQTFFKSSANHVASHRTLCVIPTVPCAGGMKIKRYERVSTPFSR